MMPFDERAALRIDAPSPPAGEGFTAARLGLGWVRGAFASRGVYHRAALCADPVAKPPSPISAEGVLPAFQIDQPA